jgi:hypothetical protein
MLDYDSDGYRLGLITQRRQEADDDGARSAAG